MFQFKVYIQCFISRFYVKFQGKYLSLWFNFESYTDAGVKVYDKFGI